MASKTPKQRVIQAGWDGLKGDPTGYDGGSVDGYLAAAREALTMLKELDAQHQPPTPNVNDDYRLGQYRGYLDAARHADKLLAQLTPTETPDGSEGNRHVDRALDPHAAVRREQEPLTSPSSLDALLKDDTRIAVAAGSLILIADLYRKDGSERVAQSLEMGSAALRSLLTERETREAEAFKVVEMMIHRKQRLFEPNEGAYNALVQLAEEVAAYREQKGRGK